MNLNYPGAIEERVERFYAHVDHCDRCRDHPFVLCAIGQILLMATGVKRPEVLS